MTGYFGQIETNAHLELMLPVKLNKEGEVKASQNERVTIVILIAEKKQKGTGTGRIGKYSRKR